jgi:subtilisin family serine protease
LQAKSFFALFKFADATHAMNYQTVILCFILLILGQSLLAKVVDGKNTVSDGKYVLDEIFVRFEDNATTFEIEEIIKKYQLKEKTRFILIKAILYSLPEDIDAAVLKPKLNKLSAVIYADLNNNGYTLAGYVSKEPFLGKQWALSNTGQVVNGRTGKVDADIDWDNAMQLYDPKESVGVAVIDTGVARDHPEINLRLGGLVAERDGKTGIDDDGNGFVDDLVGWDFRDDDNDPTDLNGHGTMVAGLIAGHPENGEGITGVAPDSYIVPLRVFGETGGATDEDIILAIAYAVTAGARVINLSLEKGQPFNFPLQEAIYALESKYDTLLVCAAGNGGDDLIGDDLDLTPVYPAAYEGKAILSVAATDQNNELARFSNFGTTKVDLAAPGTNVLAPTVSRKIIYSENFETYSNAWKEGALRSSQSSFEWRYFKDSNGNRWVTDSDMDVYENSLSYVAYTNTYLQSPSYSLKGINAPKLEVKVYHDLAYSYIHGSYDYLIFEILTDDGITWNQIGYTYGQSHRSGAIYSFDLSPYEGKEARFRFRLETDRFFQGDGVFVDDFTITGVTSFTYSGDQYKYGDGTSFAAPIVSGVAALILAQRPDLSALDARNILMQSVTRMEGLKGKMVSGGVVNAAEALRLANTWKIGFPQINSPVVGFPQNAPP